MSQPVTVFVVDDHALFRTGVKAELAGLGDDRIAVVGEAGSVGEAVVRITSDPPDVVLLDVHMPDGGGRAVLEQVHAKLPDVVFLALSVSDASEDVIAVIRAGARGYVTKTISGRELADAVVRVSAGDAVFSPRLAGFVLDAFSDRGGPAPVTDPELDLLSPREREVLKLLARGYAYKEIAAAAVHLHQDGGDARVERAAQDPEVEPLRAVPVGVGPPAGLKNGLLAAELAPAHGQQHHAQVGAGRTQRAEAFQDGHLPAVDDLGSAQALAGLTDGVRDRRPAQDQLDELGVDGVDLHAQLVDPLLAVGYGHFFGRSTGVDGRLRDGRSGPQVHRELGLDRLRGGQGTGHDDPHSAPVRDPPGTKNAPGLVDLGASSWRGVQPSTGTGIRYP